MSQKSVSINIVSKRLGLCRQTIYKLIKSGRLKAINISTSNINRWRITEKALEEFINNSQS